MSDERTAAVMAAADVYATACDAQEAAGVAYAESRGAWQRAVEANDWSSPEAKEAHRVRDAAAEAVRKRANEAAGALYALGCAARRGR